MLGINGTNNVRATNLLGPSSKAAYISITQGGEGYGTFTDSNIKGAIVVLSGKSTWTVTGTSYLTSLTIGSSASMAAASGHSVAMTVNGVSTPITPGQAYSGVIVLTIS